MGDLTQYEYAASFIRAVKVKGEVVWYEPNKRDEWHKISRAKAKKTLATYGLTSEEFLNEQQSREVPPS